MTEPQDCAEQLAEAANQRTAAQTHGWGQPQQVAEFSDGLGPSWEVYDGPGRDGNGRRALSAVTVAGGITTITGDAAGTTGGMCWLPGQRYGRWESRIKAPASDPAYNAVALLWPDAENHPAGGEIDFMDLADPGRQSANAYVHHPNGSSQTSGEITIDATKWHAWAVEWAPTHVATFVDGKEWFRTSDTSIVPAGPMHLCIQLDWFPAGANPTSTPSTMQVDWVRQYPPTPSGLLPPAVGAVVDAVLGNAT